MTKPSVAHFVTLAAGLVVASLCLAQAPAGSTGQCKDGTFTQAESKRGSCRGHGGVKEWYAEKKSEAQTETKAETKSADKKAASTAAAAPAGPPAGATGECKDGTFTQAESKRGSCKGHGGVKQWYASNKSETKSEKTSKTKESMAPPAAAPAPAPAAAAAAPKSTTTASTKKAPEGMRTEAAPGVGAGKVWVNTSSKVYHCSGDEWYGKTKEGQYMTEAQAKASGARPARDKTCG